MVLNSVLVYKKYIMQTKEQTLGKLIKSKFRNNGLVETLYSSGYKVVGGSVFYDRDGNVVYNNAKGGSDRIGGQGRYNYLALKNKATNETGYIVLCSDNKWHYTNTAPSNKSRKTFDFSVVSRLSVLI